MIVTLHVSQYRKSMELPSMTEQIQDGKENRGDLAQQRTLLAKERTFSAWIRTGLASMVAGLAIARFVESETWQWAGPLMGVLLLMVGAAIYAVGFLSYRKALRSLADQGVRGSPLWLIGAVTAALILSALLALILVIR